jgi:hypothetical protein
MKKTEMIGVLTKASAIYDNFEPTETRVGVWMDIFKNYPVADVANAVMAHCSSSQYAPKPADIIKLILEARRGPRGTANEAWGLVMQAIHRFGYANEAKAIAWLASQNRIAAKVARCMGWTELCASEQNLGDRAHFSKFYDSELAHEDRIALLPEPQRKDALRIEAERFRLPTDEPVNTPVLNLINSTAKRLGLPSEKKYAR